MTHGASFSTRAYNWTADHKVGIALADIAVATLAVALGTIAFVAMHKNPSGFGPLNALTALKTPGSAMLLIIGGILFLIAPLLIYMKNHGEERNDGNITEEHNDLDSIVKDPVFSDLDSSTQ